MRILLVSLFMLAFISGCTTTDTQSSKSDQYYQLKIMTLENQIKQMQEQIKQLEKKKEITKTNKEKDVILKQLAELSEKQQRNINYLEQIKHEITSLKNTPQNVTRYTPAKSKEAKKEKFVKYVPKKKYKPVKRKPKKSVKRNSREDESYIICYKFYIRSLFKKSEECFNNFISNFPKSSLVPNAYFWIGETYFARKEYPKAIDYYDIILTKFPSSKKIPSALLKEGLAFYQLNDNEGAKIFLEKVINDYPKTNQANYAKKYMEKYNLK